MTSSPISSVELPPPATDRRRTPLKPGEQLLAAEWLREVIVGAGVEGAQLLALLTDRRHDQDRQLAAPPHLLADLDALTVRQHEIEHQHVGRMRGQDREHVQRGPCRLDNVARGAQHDLQPADKLRLVVHDQHTRGDCGHLGLPSGQSHRLAGSSAAAAARS